MSKDFSMFEYEAAAMSTRLPSASSEYVTLGLIGEIGEFYGKWAKTIRDGTTWPDNDIKSELGDILWMLTALARDSGFSLADIAHHNVKKLQGRQKRKTLQGSGDNR